MIRRIQLLWSKDGTHFNSGPVTIGTGDQLQLMISVDVDGGGPYVGVAYFSDQKGQGEWEPIWETEVEFENSVSILSLENFIPEGVGNYKVKVLLEVAGETPLEATVPVHVVGSGGGMP